MEITSRLSAMFIDTAKATNATPAPATIKTSPSAMKRRSVAVVPDLSCRRPISASNAARRSRSIAGPNPSGRSLGSDITFISSQRGAQLVDPDR